MRPWLALLVLSWLSRCPSARLETGLFLLRHSDHRLGSRSSSNKPLAGNREIVKWLVSKGWRQLNVIFGPTGRSVSGSMTWLAVIPLLTLNPRHEL